MIQKQENKIYKQEFEKNIDNQIKLKYGEIVKIGYSPEDGIMMGGLLFKMLIKELEK